jgi:hypothetical protein
VNLTPTRALDLSVVVGQLNHPRSAWMIFEVGECGLGFSLLAVRGSCHRLLTYQHCAVTKQISPPQLHFHPAGEDGEIHDTAISSSLRSTRCSPGHRQPIVWTFSSVGGAPVPALVKRGELFIYVERVGVRATPTSTNSQPVG